MLLQKIMKLGRKVLQVDWVKWPRDGHLYSANLDPTHRSEMGPLVLFGAIRRINEPTVHAYTLYIH